MTLLLEMFLVFLLIFLNGFFVAAEFALVSVRKTRIRELSKKGNRSAKLLFDAVSDLETYISATQLGITLASLALGWIGEPTVAHLIEPAFRLFPSPLAVITLHTVSVVIAFCLITFLHIVLGELVPKTAALQNPEKTAFFVVTPLLIFTKIFRPFIWFLNVSGSFVVKYSGLSSKNGKNSVHSEEEIKMIISQSAAGGAIENQEMEMMHKVLQLADILVQHIMIPRTEINAIDENIVIKELKKKINTETTSRYPVFHETIDNIIGYIHEKDILKLSSQKSELSLSETGLVRKIINVPEVQRIDDVLLMMRKKRVHMAVVNDEFGGTAGMVTLEDVIESVVGEIYDEFDKPEPQIYPESDGSYTVDGYFPTQQIRQKFNVPIRSQGYITIGGVVFGLLGRQPRLGDIVKIDNLTLKVKQIENRRIKTLVLTIEKKDIIKILI